MTRNCRSVRFAKTAGICGLLDGAREESRDAQPQHFSLRAMQTNLVGGLSIQRALTIHDPSPRLKSAKGTFTTCTCTRLVCRSKSTSLFTNSACASSAVLPTNILFLLSSPDHVDNGPTRSSRFQSPRYVAGRWEIVQSNRSQLRAASGKHW
ncbi:hypothetical protein EJ05DRAFT_478331 [Pseudovirgaria hyperparasitica]|uniref:Uncharacterized protein n=1 Tax=Pseudovirgaria hyperparasitica TaxID=470096 RepID=A0A6A6VXH5_9PEZI|nr:uncharacterized protein EJ05DRAFT_478331 [Pseudovirgaria hyperparasitica]KAF2755312.1 hypothetical protein EJ05DRAFT_478331 [Pseudovirgaria hyperparasitica]